jgi:hypothetical protein
MGCFNQERSERWRLASWLENHCKRNSENWQEYEEAKVFLKSTSVDYEAGIKIITDYLNI